MTFTKKMLLASVLFLSSVGAAQADEMSWDLKNKSGMKCHLSDGMTLRHGTDFVETKKLVCWSGTEMKVAQSVSCGPEGSVTKFGRKIRVKCSAQTFARK